MFFFASISNAFAAVAGAGEAHGAATHGEGAIAFRTGIAGDVRLAAVIDGATCGGGGDNASAHQHVALAFHRFRRIAGGGDGYSDEEMAAMATELGITF